ncbi:hypothetical protein HX109_10635 [Galbibacter sp. BG1]|uniref:hypothetical protein n=1 Tax=Galbibacter sp. BG1 TaxID=1170699 RepID=UPI0015B84865|nr:hypothetical protein [Galbibacter sp. BG1]QLE01986.1 hypothetical protein HX109_10635 [Galbibacter sp. BG1]
MVGLDKYIEKNENAICVVLTIKALVLIIVFGELYFIAFFVFIFLGFKIILPIFQLILLSIITPEQEKAYETKLKQRSKENEYRETRVGLNISKRDWNKFSIERKNSLNSLYSNQKKVIWNNFSHKNPNSNITYKSSQYFNVISKANNSLEWQNISEKERVSLIEKYDRLQYKRQKVARLKEEIKRKPIFEEQKELNKITESKEIDFTFKFLKYASIALIFFIVFTCGSRKKIGAKCRDGTSSYSTGSGTCSHHNGVKSWKYEYWWD